MIPPSLNSQEPILFIPLRISGDARNWNWSNNYNLLLVPNECPLFQSTFPF